ncbi:MAG: hydrogenase nickel incorporation protein HypB, partial [Candidatus Krumholzibacteria bacterium]|nr:hydrogenase nickel incorporation protein HypB [Candidatus Krumholzibacteria bacterium]
ARMVDKGLGELSIENQDFLFIENVGNLVCPAGFDLGEDAKIVLLSVTEGDDKPLKYPNIIVRSDLVILNKMDLLPYVPFDEHAVLTNARRVNPRIEILKTSCTSGEGIDEWFRWLRERLKTFRSRTQELN